jgi:hypothetical protein
VTDAVGGTLLKGMFALAAPLIQKVIDELPGGKEAEGKSLYAQKPNVIAHAPRRAHMLRAHAHAHATCTCTAPTCTAPTCTAPHTRPHCDHTKSSLTSPRTAPMHRTHPLHAPWLLPQLGQNGVTWSQSDYGHRGLQAEYLRLKSVQRFTEGWVAMQRVYNLGALRHLMGSADAAGGARPTLRVASFGGGPGFELVAARAFCERHLPRAQLDLISIDLATEWQPCAEGLGLRFNHWCALGRAAVPAPTAHRAAWRGHRLSPPPASGADPRRDGAWPRCAARTAWRWQGRQRR